MATGCLERALTEPPAPEARGQVLFELGSAQIFRAPAAAVDNLTEALARATGWPGRGEIALALGRALALCGRFADAVAVAQEAMAGRARTVLRPPLSLQADLLNVARWDLQTRPVIWPVLGRLQARADAGEELDPQLHANLAVELAAAGRGPRPRDPSCPGGAGATPQLMSRTPAALADAVVVLVYAGVTGEARDAVQTWLRLAQRRGWPLSSCLAASVASSIALHDGDVRQALAYGQQATASGDWISVITTAYMIVALIDRGAVGQARDHAGRGQPGRPARPDVAVHRGPAGAGMPTCRGRRPRRGGQ